MKNRKKTTICINFKVNEFLMFGRTNLIWKLIFVLSSGAMNDLATAPAIPPDAEWMNTFDLLWESSFLLCNSSEIRDDIVKSYFWLFRLRSLSFEWCDFDKEKIYRRDPPDADDFVLSLFCDDFMTFKLLVQITLHWVVFSFLWLREIKGQFLCKEN